ncbi:MAG: hypothetical protein FAF03_00720 [Epsilonproteobacteria bacterium]|nr:hypothetical protein [Campylobacterota bacterium]
MRKIKNTIVVLSLCMCTVATSAQEKSMDELSQELANPLAQIWNLSFPYFTYQTQTTPL